MLKTDRKLKRMKVTESFDKNGFIKKDGLDYKEKYLSEKYVVFSKRLLIFMFIIIATVTGAKISSTYAAVYDEDNYASFGKLTINKTYSQQIYEMASFECTYTPKYSGEYRFCVWGSEECQVVMSDKNGANYYAWSTDRKDNESIYSWYLEEGTTYTFNVSKYYGEDEIIKFRLVKSFVPKLELDGDRQVLAKGVRQKLILEYGKGCKSITWTSSNPKVVSVTSGGTIKGLAKGTATVKVKGIDYAGDKFTSKVKINVSDPKISSKNISINLYGMTKSENGMYYLWDGNQIVFKGLSKYSSIEYKSSSKNLIVEPMYSLIDTTDRTYSFYPKKKGNYKITFTIDGKNIVCNVKVMKMWFSRNSKTVADSMNGKWEQNSSLVLMSKGEQTTLKVKGNKAKVKFKSSNTKVAKINSKGVLTAKGNGYTTISATADGFTIKYKVAVSKKASVKAIRYAIKHFNSKYSQPKRMQKGYYDCSSYVWRSYASARYYIGGSKNWAPTAADLAKWCADKGYVKLNGKIKYSKMMPGDLVFECGSDNGRYKGIYHVDLYVGNGVSLTVARSKYWYEGKCDVIVARPYR